MKRTVIILFSSLLYVSSCYASSPEEKKYQVTETQLMSLENRLQRLKQINQLNLTDLKSQQKRLVELELKSQRLEKKLEISYSESRKQEELLKNANQLLMTYEKETKAKIRKEKTQKIIWMGIAGGLLGVVIKNAVD